ncbi:DUF6489 family protein [Thiorhodospira sibirica]|uniref:DUF6489 family protein n=1 Tax=Thiorhodospira sibirica TaxID=154347 RepID=UPI00022C1124|nr:DUF6489 family protein [Thiorhodospira sibirica]
MKVTVDIEAKPEELRVFMGFPDVRPLQDELMARMRDQYLEMQDPESMALLMQKMVMGGMQTATTMEKFFWEAFRQQSEMMTGSKNKDK